MGPVRRAMLFCQLGRAKSLREICGGLAACEGKLSLLGIRAPKRATMAYANEHRPWQLYKAVFFQLLGRCQAVAQGLLLRNIFASVAEYERELIRERVKAGLARARARGRRLGRPPRAVDLTQVTALRQAGSSWRRIAQALTVPTSTVYRAARG